MRVVVTGGAGFVGSNLVDALVAAGHETVVVDDFSTGDERFLGEGGRPRPAVVVSVDLAHEPERLAMLVKGADAVFHLAANADVRFGWNAPYRNIEQNVLVTQHVCDAMRRTGVRRLLFTSTGSVYGEAAVVPTPEDCPFPVQTSLYGASKAAAEGFIAAYAEAGYLDATVFRLVSVMGPRYTHGHVVDFLRQLTRDPTRLVVLGDGSQRKSYVDITDCVSAMLLRLGATPQFEVLNLGADDYCTVKDSVLWITERLGVTPEVQYTGGDRGWVGDNPFIWLDTGRLRAFGWKATVEIPQAIERTVDYLLAHRWVLERSAAR